MLISQLVLRSASTASPHIQSTHEIYGRKWIMVDHLPLIETSRARARAQPQPKRSPMNDKTIARTHTRIARTFIRSGTAWWCCTQFRWCAAQAKRDERVMKRENDCCRAPLRIINEEWRENWNVSFMRPRYVCTRFPYNLCDFEEKRNTKREKRNTNRAKNINSFRLHFSIYVVVFLHFLLDERI